MNVPGIAADFVGNCLYHVLRKLPGTNLQTRCASMWLHMQEFYERHSVSDCLRNLTIGMIKQKQKSPKMRGSAAQIRALVPFALVASDKWLDANDPVEQAIQIAARHLKASSIHKCSPSL